MLCKRSIPPPPIDLFSMTSYLRSAGIGFPTEGKETMTHGPERMQSISQWSRFLPVFPPLLWKIPILPVWSDLVAHCEDTMRSMYLGSLGSGWIIENPPTAGRGLSGEGDGFHGLSRCDW